MNGLTWRILTGDALERLRDLETESVQTVVTSPPYWGLRDYGVDGQIGLEVTPEEFVARLVDVFREVRRVLRKNGTLWINIGDSYASAIKGSGGRSEKHGCKPKDLVGVPWMLAFALRADGWFLRSEIIWSKPNPMPESVTDRPTKAHENLFLLSKSKRYFYDWEAIAEPAVATENRGGSKKLHANGPDFYPGERSAVHGGLGDAWEPRRRPSVPRGGFSGKTEAMAGEGRNAFRAVVEIRNKRSVWEIGTEPFSGAHFAVMPTALVDPCLSAGSRVGEVVLDPFAGAGTTLVALELGRHFVGIELNPEFVEIARARLGSVAPLLAREVSS